MLSSRELLYIIASGCAVCCSNFINGLSTSCNTVLRIRAIVNIKKKKFIMLQILGTFSAIWGFYYIYLSLWVVKERSRHQINIGDGTLQLIECLVNIDKNNNKKEENDNSNKLIISNDSGPINVHKYNRLIAAIRSHSNFNEFIPLIAILSAILELQNANTIYLIVSLSLLTVGRIIYVAFGTANPNMRGWGRHLGIIITFLTILSHSIYLLYSSNYHSIYSHFNK
ncbi:hypothetical protein DFA_09441 [Cavenderia fasciculata]|uniref:MAPEG family protein n=1 Tax=Cavenderia fasciculata TaxID=261658 RepID=F4Q7M4_CACFS|nr:uncharacterized protein DFA_09441 [Cavenderia fasciculata]EGG16406.1 hypothetical protein DFA_09441 [Cavenderia fasciculata]|eukprot:XP_004354790.1 hypothetical protein DFA_09441 [Cavenderia fasciculata]